MSRIIFPRELKLDPARLPKSGKVVGELQEALARVALVPAGSDLARKELGASTLEAVKAFNESVGLPAEAQVTVQTVARLNATISHRFVAGSRTRTARLQTLLKAAGHAVAPKEIGSRRFGETTRQAVSRAQAQLGLAATGEVDAAFYAKLREQAVQAKLATKSGVADVQRTLIQALGVAKLKDRRIDLAELRGRTIGPTTQVALRAFQAKYGLPETGAVDAATMDRIGSVAGAVKGPAPAALKAGAAGDLRPLRKTAWLNMAGPHVLETQRTLAFLGYRIEEREAKAKSFGPTTRQAVLRFQRERNLPETGHVDPGTRKAINTSIAEVNPASATGTRSRMRGSVRDELWQGLAGIRIEVWHRPVTSEAQKLAETLTQGNGFYDVAYDPPVDAVTKTPLASAAIETRFVAKDGTSLGAVTQVSPTRIAWSNLTRGDRPYRGPSEFETWTAEIERIAGAGQLPALVETKDKPQITRIAAATRILPDDILRLVLAHKVAATFDPLRVPPEAFYGFLAQGLPTTLSGDLLASTVNFSLIGQLVAEAAEQLVLSDAINLASAFDRAADQNLLPIATIRKRAAILEAIDEFGRTWMFESFRLPGKVTLRDLAGLSSMPVAIAQQEVAAVLRAYRGFPDAFWAALESEPQRFGGAVAIGDLKVIVDLGTVTKNFLPLVKHLHNRILDPADPLKTARHTARMSDAQWRAELGAIGDAVPDDTDGPDKVATYAATLANLAAATFPTVSILSAVATVPEQPFQHLDKIDAMLDEHPDIDLIGDNLDAELAQRAIAADPDVLAEARALQRICRLTRDPAIAKALVAAGIHSAAQVNAMGKAQAVAALTRDKLIDDAAARTVVETALAQTALVLKQIVSYQVDSSPATPAAVGSYYNIKAKPTLNGQLVSLETLFGSLDFCACSHCQSVYGPAAYFADLLRFLGQHPSERPGKSVRDLLFERRPDLGEIKLNCANTETALPYVDLVNEVLESCIPAPGPERAFKHQTTRPAPELRATPEHVRAAAYDALRKADAPITSAFDLWQEQSRVYLQHLGTPRWELMEMLQAREAQPQAPADASIAGEFFCLSSHETSIVTTADASDARQATFWGLATPLPGALPVDRMLRLTGLTYEELLALLSCRWVNPTTDPNPMTVDRPNATCDTTQQSVTGLTAARLDRINRFLRLKRRTGWASWELDLLLRAPAVGNGSLGPQALTRLMQVARVQARLRLSVERMLVLFGDINAEIRHWPSEPDRREPSLWDLLFRNPAIVTPLDDDFILPLADGLTLDAHTAPVLAALSLSESDLARLRSGPANGLLTVANLSTIARHTMLAQALGLPLAALLDLRALAPAIDPFSGLASLVDFLDAFDWVGRSRFEIVELRFLLTEDPDSPLGARDETVGQQANAVRAALRGIADADRARAVAAQVSASFGVSSEIAAMLLDRSERNGRSFTAILTDAAFLATKTGGEFATPAGAAGFPDVFAALRALAKMCLLVSRLALTGPDLAWLFTKGAAAGFLSPGNLPAGAPPAAALFPKWLLLAQWCALKALYPEPEGRSWTALFDSAGARQPADAPAIRLAISQLMQLPAGSVDEMAQAMGMRHGAAISDYLSLPAFLRLDRAARASRRAGVTPAVLLRWALRDDDGAEAQMKTALETRQAARAKYDEGTWLGVVTPLENKLREARRDALVAYLIALSQRSEAPVLVEQGRSYPNPAYWTSPDDLLNFLLIDVAMGPIQLTSRLKQAIGSVQMFAQRCLIGLEQPRIEVSHAEQNDPSAPDSWRQWRWMRTYRVWEANRKVFLYPENWIEPELRDDKSPFFKELEDEILQSDMDDEAVGDAFVHYLEKLHEVSRLEIMGTYHEVDDLDPRDNLSSDVNLLHVVARTASTPAAYYYRRYDLNAKIWTAWERINVDIDGEHVTPVIYNRRLYLFWLTIIERPQKIRKMPAAKPSDKPQDSPEPPNQLEIQLAWSGRTKDGWTAKTLSREKLIHPWQRPQHAYNLKPRYKSRENMLWLDLYVSQTTEFNSTKFWDAYASTNAFATKRTPYDPAARPWHSSSFLFDGEVVDVRMKPLKGFYHVVDSSGGASADLQSADSVTFVRSSFGAATARLEALTGPYETGPRLPMPDGLHYSCTRLVNMPGNASLLNVLENGATKPLLSGARAPFAVVAPQNRLTFDTVAWGITPVFYQDRQRAFMIQPEWYSVANGSSVTVTTRRYRFSPAYHPYSALFLREAKRAGAEGVIQRDLQTAPQTWYPGNGFAFSAYQPTAHSLPSDSAVADRIDFDRSGAFALYNWEVFFQIPFAIACWMAQHQRHEEAMRWFHLIFDPMSTSGTEVPQRYWVTKPFYEMTGDDARKQRIEELLKNIGQNLDQLFAWRNNPFQPHVIARFRPVAYQKAVVMKYLDNLIAWGDRLFQQDTIEAINEATTLYVLAHSLLGRRPVAVPDVGRAELTYNELLTGSGLDAFANKRADVVLENFTDTPVRITRVASGSEPMPSLDVFYFGIPNNDRLLGYWDVVEDRLFKIRNSLNVAGIKRELPLFEPPIDPALLIKAAAAGVDIGAAVDGLNLPIGPYRFRKLVEKAVVFCAELSQLGERLLAALEKRDAVTLELLRNNHEVALQSLVRDVRKAELAEAQQTKASLDKALATAQVKQSWYGGRDKINVWEGAGLALGTLSAGFETAIAVGYAAVGGLSLIPGFIVGGSGFGGTPHATIKVPDGVNFSKAAEGAVLTLSALSRTAEKWGALATTMGQYQRRQEEWDFQKDLAEAEIAQVEKQILAAEMRIAAIEKDIERLDLQIEQARSVNDYLRSKYTAAELYDWHVRQISSVFFQAYQLAFGMARRAEKAFQEEIGDIGASFIQFGHWDSLRKGLLSGEKLAQDIRRMEATWLERNVRDLEITRHVSLAQLFPRQLLQLKTKGSCTVDLPEWLFDLDYPGHYFRRIKSVSLTIPCVVGPYQSINCTLTLTQNGIRVRDDAGPTYGDALAAPDDRFRRGLLAQSMIATSSGQNDSGLFELRFDDDRYLPFEGAGVASQWQIELPGDPQVQDVILHVSYTSRVGGVALRDAALANLNAVLPTAGASLLVLSQDFASEWHRFLHSEAGKDQVLSFSIDERHLPLFARKRGNSKLAQVDLVVTGEPGQAYDAEITRPAAAAAAAPFNVVAEFGAIPVASLGGFGGNAAVLGDWQIKVRRRGAGDFRSLGPDELRTAFLVLRITTD